MTLKKTTSLTIIILIALQLVFVQNYSLGKANNLRTSQGKIFNGMYANYTFEIQQTTYFEANTGFTYTNDVGHFYNVTWWIEGRGTHTWLENLQSRLISDTSGVWSFDNNVHTPVWIFTNHSVGDLILIAVGDDGERIYNITGDQSYYHPNYGNRYVWVLQNIFFPDSLAYYEKTTGILIDGYFIFHMGQDNYNLTLTETNIFSYYQGGDTPPLYLLIIIIAITGICILVIVRKRKLEPKA
jgi:hypothetical protein